MGFEETTEFLKKRNAKLGSCNLVGQGQMLFLTAPKTYWIKLVFYENAHFIKKKLRIEKQLDLS